MLPCHSNVHTAADSFNSTMSQTCTGNSIFTPLLPLARSFRRRLLNYICLVAASRGEGEAALPGSSPPTAATLHFSILRPLTAASAAAAANTVRHLNAPRAVLAHSSRKFTRHVPVCALTPAHLDADWLRSPSAIQERVVGIATIRGRVLEGILPVYWIFLTPPCSPFRNAHRVQDAELSAVS